MLIARLSVLKSLVALDFMPAHQIPTVETFSSVVAAFFLSYHHLLLTNFSNFEV